MGLGICYTSASLDGPSHGCPNHDIPKPIIPAHADASPLLLHPTGPDRWPSRIRKCKTTMHYSVAQAAPGPDQIARCLPTTSTTTLASGPATHQAPHAAPRHQSQNRGFIAAQDAPLLGMLPWCCTLVYMLMFTRSEAQSIMWDQQLAWIWAASLTLILMCTSG